VRSERAFSVVAYSVTRIVSYAAMGAIAGVFGLSIARWLEPAPLRWISTIFAASILVWRGLALFAGPRLFSIRRPTSPRSGANLPQKGAWASGMWVAIQREGAPIRSLGLGAITPYLPCGVSWTALLLAATLGHPAASIGFMAIFALASALPIAFVAYAAGGMLGWRPSVSKKRLFGALLIAVAGAMIAAPLVARPSPTCPCHQYKAGS
jgi:hypothetical protein